MYSIVSMCAMVGYQGSSGQNGWTGFGKRANIVANKKSVWPTWQARIPIANLVTEVLAQSKTTVISLQNINYKKVEWTRQIGE